MKRSTTDLGDDATTLFQHIDVSVGEIVGPYRPLYKKANPNETKQPRTPPNFITLSHAHRLTVASSQILNELASKEDSDRMNVDADDSNDKEANKSALRHQELRHDASKCTKSRLHSKEPWFVFFLGVQGKEYIEHISKQFTTPARKPLFVTCNSNLKGNLITTNAQCVKLATELNVFDPLGCGLYPLDYVFIIDGCDRVRCATPLVVNKNIHQLRSKNKGGETKYATFGLELSALDGFISEYDHYFSDGDIY